MVRRKCGVRLTPEECNLFEQWSVRRGPARVTTHVFAIPKTAVDWSAPRVSHATNLALSSCSMSGGPFAQGGLDKVLKDRCLASTTFAGPSVSQSNSSAAYPIFLRTLTGYRGRNSGSISKSEAYTPSASAIVFKLLELCGLY